MQTWYQVGLLDVLEVGEGVLDLQHRPRCASIWLSPC